MALRLLATVSLALAVAAGSSAPAQAATPCAGGPGKRVFVLKATALTGPHGTDVSVAVSSRKRVCRLPNALRGVAVEVGDRRVKTVTNVPAALGRANVRIPRLDRGQQLTVWVTIQTPQTGRRAHLVSVRARTLLRPDLVVELNAPLSALVGSRFTVRAQVRERNGDVGAAATVTLSAGGTPVAVMPVRARAGRRATVTLPATVPAVGTHQLVAAISRAAPSETNTDNNDATASIAITVFQLAPAKELVPSFVGHGAQFNQHVYAAISRSVGVTEDNVKDMEAKVVALEPQFVRVFFHPVAFNDSDEMESFVRAVQLAQRAGATINVTWQGGGTNDPATNMARFGDVLADLVRRGVTRLRWVTVQNEVNATRITMAQYEQFYRLLDARLRAVGVREQIRFMGGDLVGTVSPLGQTQDQWFAFMASRMADVLDAWSVHIYWDYWDTPRIERRLIEVRQIYDALPANGRKPLYVTEFSARGIRTLGGVTYPDPGVFADSVPIAQTNINAFQHAWFNVLASKLGYYGTIKWDAYFAKYDRGTQVYYMIGSPQEGWPLRPAYHVTRLFTRAVAAGWKVVGLDGASGTQLLAGYTGPNGGVALIGLDTSGAQLNGLSPTQVAYNVGGVPPNTAFQLLVWNADGSGRLGPVTTVRSDAAGVLNLSIPLHAVFAVTTL